MIKLKHLDAVLMMPDDEKRFVIKFVYLEVGDTVISARHQCKHFV